MSEVYIALGGNIGNTHAYFIRAIRALNECGIKVQRVSDFMRSAPYGGVEQAIFLNAVLEARTDKEPLELLRALKDIEVRLGRVASERWGPRCIDLDILLYDDLQLQTPQLTIPHKDMHNRDFVLIPLQQLRGKCYHERKS